MYSTNAATSEARKFSPSPRPITSGELRRAPTTRPGSSSCTARSVNAPSSWATTCWNASRRFLVLRYSRPRSTAATSESVSLMKREAVGEQFLLERGEVLDDAVVDEREFAVVAEVRVRVLVGRGAVGRPAGVADAGVADFHGAGLHVTGEDGELAGTLAGAHLSGLVDHGDAGGVVPAILQSAETAEKDIDAVVAADVTHDSTHGLKDTGNRLGTYVRPLLRLRVAQPVDPLRRNRSLGLGPARPDHAVPADRCRGRSSCAGSATGSTSTRWPRCTCR